jgi:hypothetical protein
VLDALGLVDGELRRRGRALLERLGGEEAGDGAEDEEQRATKKKPT